MTPRAWKYAAVFGSLAWIGVAALVITVLLFWRYILEGLFLLFCLRIALAVLGGKRRARGDSSLRAWLETLALGWIGMNTRPAKKYRAKLEPVYDTKPRPGDLPKGY